MMDIKNRRDNVISILRKLIKSGGYGVYIHTEFPIGFIYDIFTRKIIRIRHDTLNGLVLSYVTKYNNICGYGYTCAERLDNVTDTDVMNAILKGNHKAVLDKTLGYTYDSITELLQDERDNMGDSYIEIAPDE